MGGEIEGHRQALLARREVAAIEGVGIFRRREAGVLPHRPGLVDIHGGVRAAQERRGAGIGLDGGQALDVLGAVDALHFDAFRRQPGLFRESRRRGALVRRKGEGREIGYVGHPGVRLMLIFAPYTAEGSPAPVGLYSALVQCGWVGILTISRARADRCWSKPSIIARKGSQPWPRHSPRRSPRRRIAKAWLTAESEASAVTPSPKPA